MAFNPFKKLVRGLSRTREGIGSALRSMAGSHPVDENAIDNLEVSLLAADLGPALTGEVVDTVRERVHREGIDGDGMRAVVKAVIRDAIPAPVATIERRRDWCYRQLACQCFLLRFTIIIKSCH